MTKKEHLINCFHELNDGIRDRWNWRSVYERVNDIKHLCMSLSTVIFDVKEKLLHENTPNTDHKHMTYFMLHSAKVRLFNV